MDILQLIKDLESFGYQRNPFPRSFGGDFAMRRPDGSIVWEKDFDREVDKLLDGVHGTESIRAG